MKLIVGNWKMNQTQSEVEAFINEINEANLNTLAWIAPQFIHLPLCLSKKSKLIFGAQNCSNKKSGAFTGEVSALALKDLGCHFVIIGHSERRQLFNETSELLGEKIKEALSNNLHVIYCVGETLLERQNKQTLSIVKDQLEKALHGINFSEQNITIAYEPVWAIGTGLNATANEAEEVHSFIRQWLGNKKVRILYGGSVKPSNIKDLLTMPNIDGALVGGASLKAQDFTALCQ